MSPTQSDPTKPATLVNRVLARLSYEAGTRPYTAALIRAVLEDELRRWLKERGIEEALR